jgi:hypothetical protein
MRRFAAAVLLGLVRGCAGDTNSASSLVTGTKTAPAAAKQPVRLYVEYASASLKAPDE